MGKTYSRDVKTTGDPQVNIVNTLERHTELHDNNNVLLWALLIICGIQLTITIYKLHMRRVKKLAYKKASKSVLTLSA